MWVFWVHASTTARFEQAYREIADKVQLPGRDDSKTNILQLVYNWLRGEMNGRWLMIIDNADDDQVFALPHANNDSNGIHFSPEAAVALAGFVPQASNGWILVTSRDLAAAINLVGGKQNVIHVDPMDEHDALALLKSKMQVDDHSEKDAKALVEILERIPLAITHAAAYITANEPTMNVSKYLELFRESEENQASLLNNKDARDIRRDSSVSDAVITTWQLSFEQIRKTKPEAADLLSLMTMFDRQGIPEYLLYDGGTRLQFTEAVGPLFRFSLISAQTGKQSSQPAGGQFLGMHSLVHLAMREWVRLHNQMSTWHKVALRILATTFPDGELETWLTCRTLLPHTLKVYGYGSEKAHRARLDRAKLASNTAWYPIQMGEYAEAERLVRSAVKARKEVLGLEHQDTLRSINYLGVVLERQGKYEEAEVMHQQALQGCKRVLGDNHPDTLIAMGNLAVTLKSQRQLVDAENLQTQALEASKRVLGDNHPRTLVAMGDLASTFWDQGQLVDAENLETRVLATRKRVLGNNHPDTLLAMENLALTMRQLGRNQEALSLVEICVEGRGRVLGLDHPYTRDSTAWLNDWRSEDFSSENPNSEEQDTPGLLQ